MRPFDHLTLMQFTWAALSILGFSIRVNLRGWKIFFLALGGGLSWAIYLIFLYYSDSLLFSIFCSVILVCSYSEIVARLLKVPVSVFVTCVIIPLVPGSNLYYAMQGFISGNSALAAQNSYKVLLISGTIAMAIAVVSSVTNLIFRLRNRF
ncbi:MAG: threonine/serine exporter family protein [Candidatus Cloacimonetes bacterium]|nr:threonine/serine exporter family protein [Candidatus Cloacimonadota bacterium]MDD4224127.1 threonine/serine exporter family protein [Candidatus Cloacimonadota bacterium]